MQHNITISGGTGSKSIVNGTYSASATVTGYDNSTISPTSVSITEGTNSYSFTIAATGTLTLHVSESGQSSGTAVEGATFIRCDSSGNTYGTAVTSDSSGNAEFANVPYASENAPTIYYKQTASDGSHVFDDSLKNTSLTSSTGTVEVQNSLAPSRTVNLTDANYENLPIDSGTITLTSSS